MQHKTSKAFNQKQNKSHFYKWEYPVEKKKLISLSWTYKNYAINKEQSLFGNMGQHGFVNIIYSIFACE